MGSTSGTNASWSILCTPLSVTTPASTGSVTRCTSTASSVDLPPLDARADPCTAAERPPSRVARPSVLLGSADRCSSSSDTVKQLLFYVVETGVVEAVHLELFFLQTVLELFFKGVLEMLHYFVGRKSISSVSFLSLLMLTRQNHVAYCCWEEVMMT